MKDVLITYTSGIGIPKIVFEIATASSNYKGAAAITSCLKNFSMRIGMEEGIGVFVFMGILSYKIASYSVLRFYKDKIERDRLILKLKNIDAIIAQIDTYTISTSSRKKLKIFYLLPNY